MRALLLAVPALALTTGCMMEREYTDPFQAVEDFGDDGFDSESNISVRSGRVSGDLGPVRDFDADARDASGYSDGTYSSINVTAYDAAGRMGMLIVDLDGADLRTARAGRYEFSSMSTSSVDGGTPYITGCSEDTSSYYDAPAEEGVIVITDTPQGREVEVEAQLPTDDGFGTAQAAGSFIIDRS